MSPICDMIPWAKPYSRKLRVLLTISLLLTGSGCLSPIALHQAVIEYDRTTAKIQAELLLLNIARAQHVEPLHFTAVTSVAATFNFETTVGIAPGQAGLTETIVAPVFTATVSENPTITIVPIEGGEFTKRVLAPVTQEKFSFLATQGVEPGLLIRLLAEKFIAIEDNETNVFRNNPKYKDQYIEFRKRVLHLSSLMVANQLHLEHIRYEKRLPFKLPPEESKDNIVQSLDEIIGAEEKGYRWRSIAKGGTRVLTKKVRGRLAITNYSMRELSNEERRLLHEEARVYTENTILVDIRPDKPGGNFPIHGFFWFRSFEDTLQFVARENSTFPGFDVRPDPRTGPIGPNPPLPLKIEVSSNDPANAAFKVKHHGFWYWIKKGTGGRLPKGDIAWNLEAFRTLNQLYQMTVADVSHRPTPSITIAK